MLFIADLWGPNGPPSGAPCPFRKVKQTHEFILFMDSSIARGCVRTTMTKFSVNCVSAEKLNGYGTRALCGTIQCLCQSDGVIHYG